MLLDLFYFLLDLKINPDLNKRRLNFTQEIFVFYIFSRLIQNKKMIISFKRSEYVYTSHDELDKSSWNYFFHSIVII